MKTIRHLLLALGILLAGSAGHAATRVVAPGNSIQATIDASSTGDLVILLPGTYDEDLVINGKALTLRPLNVTPQIKSITVQNAPAPSSFTDLRLLGDLNASASAVALYKCNVLGDVNAADADLKLLQNTNVDGNVVVTKGGLRLMKSTVHGTVTVSHATDDSNRELEAVILQSTIRERFVCRAKRSWVCYSNFRDTYFEGKVEITRNFFNGRANEYGGIGIDLNGTATVAVVRNNRVNNFRKNTSADISDECIGIRITGGAKADVINNVIYSCYDYGPPGAETRCGMGVFVQSTSGTKILGNIIWDCYVSNGDGTGHRLVRAPNANVTLQYNVLHRTNHVHSDLVGGGVVNHDGINADPRISNWDTLSLHSDSPCINAGPPNAQYNDHDGSRNDIGGAGGHGYLPNGRTTDKPIPLSLDVAPVFVPAGGVITIQSTGGTVK